MDAATVLARAVRARRWPSIRQAFQLHCNRRRFREGGAGARGDARQAIGDRHLARRPRATRRRKLVQRPVRGLARYPMAQRGTRSLTRSSGLSPPGAGRQRERMQRPPPGATRGVVVGDVRADARAAVRDLEEPRGFTNRLRQTARQDAAARAHRGHCGKRALTVPPVSGAARRHPGAWTARRRSGRARSPARASPPAPAGRRQAPSAPARSAR